MLSNEIFAIREDGDGLFWLMHDVPFHYSYNGFTLFDPLKKKTIDPKTHFPADFPIDFTQQFYPYPAPDHSLYILDRSGLLLHYKNNENYKVLGKIQTPVDWGLVGYITKIIVEEEGAFWINFPSSLKKYDINCNLLVETSIWDDYYVSDITEDLIINGIHKPNSDRTHVILQLSEHGQITKDSKIHLDARLLYYNPNEKTRIKVHEGQVIFEMEGKGEVILFSSESESWTMSAENRWLIKKINNIYWLISPFNGFYKLTINESNFINYYTGIQQRGIVTDQFGKIWLHNSKKPDKKFVKPEFQVGVYEPFALMKSKDGTLWGFNAEDKLEKFAPPEYNSQVFESVHPRDYAEWYIHEDSKNRIWFFDSLSYFNTSLEQLVFKSEWQRDNPISGAHRYFMDELADGNLFIGTSEGLHVLDPEKGFVEKFGKEENNSNYLPSNKIHHWSINENGVWWIATGDAGLLKWDKQNGIYQQFSIDNGFPSNRLHAIYQDDDGFYWINSEDGIIRWDEDREFARLYTEVDGLLHPEGNRVSHYMDEFGTIYFGSVRGITQFNPHDFNQDSVKELKSIKIQDVYQSTWTSNFFELTDRYEQFVAEKGLIMKRNENYAEIIFAPLSYSENDNIEFWYKLHDEWINMNGNKLILSGIHYGDHEISVRAENSSGIITLPFSFQAVSKPPLYLNVWFILLCLGLAGLAIWLLVRRHVKRLNRQRKFLEDQITERTREIILKNASIEEKNVLLAQQTEDLRKLDEMKSELFANLSHELRTPLTLIQGPINSVLNSNTLTNRDRPLMLTAKNNVGKLNKLVNQIMDLSKMDAGLLRHSPVQTNFYNLLRQLVTMFESHAQRDGKRLLFEYRINRKIVVELDSDKFEKIISNLLTNAFRFTGRGDSIEVIVTEAPDKLNVIVRDSGQGIPKEDMPLIFDRFYQSKTNTRTSGGSGIGLAICQEYAKVLGGKVSAKSQLGQGSIFYVEVPKREILGAAKLAQSQTVTHQKEKHSGSMTQVEKGLAAQDNGNEKTRSHILVVEDNPELREYLKFILNERFNVNLAENGQVALNMLNHVGNGSGNGIPDLIISDIMMPEVDGNELVKQMRASEKFNLIPVLMLTARTTLKDKLLAYRIGVDDYMIKPFDEEELLVRIDKLLKNSQQRQEYVQDELDNKDINLTLSTEISKLDLIWLEKLETTVHDHLGEVELNVDKLASLMSLSRTQLYRKTKSLTGLSPSLYLREVRLQKARAKIESGQFTTIKEVAFSVGITKSSYFAALYQDRFGKLPSKV